MPSLPARPDTSISAEPRPALLLEPMQPLWQRLPRRDAEGRRLADFMMLIPRLNRRPRVEIHACAHALERVLHGYGDRIAFVELNLRLNTLWVSVSPIPGLCRELPIAIQGAIPEALLVGPRPVVGD